jgi:hypothetical protein
MNAVSTGSDRLLDHQSGGMAYQRQSLKGIAGCVLQSPGDYIFMRCHHSIMFSTVRFFSFTAAVFTIVRVAWAFRPFLPMIFLPFGIFLSYGPLPLFGQRLRSRPESGMIRIMVTADRGAFPIFLYWLPGGGIPYPFH